MACAALTVTLPLATLLDLLPEPTVLIGEDYRIRAANPAYCEAFGLTLDAVVGQCCHVVSHQSDTPCHQHGEACPHAQVFRHDADFAAPHHPHAKNGGCVHVRAHPVRDVAGGRWMLETVKVAPAGATPAGAVQGDIELDYRLQRIERAAIEELLRQRFSRRAIASQLGISERTLYRKLSKYGLCDDAAHDASRA